MELFHSEQNLKAIHNPNCIKFVQCGGTIAMKTNCLTKIHVHFCLKWMLDENWLFWRWTHKIKNPQSVTFVWTLSTLEKSQKIVFSRDQYIVIHHAIIRFQKIRIDPVILHALYGSNLEILKKAQKRLRMKLLKSQKK
jgi:hypothetical protein